MPSATTTRSRGRGRLMCSGQPRGGDRRSGDRHLRHMHAADTGQAVCEALRNAVTEHASRCPWTEVSEGDAVIVAHDDPNAPINVALRLSEDLFEAPGRRQVRIAVDYGCCASTRRATDACWWSAASPRAVPASRRSLRRARSGDRGLSAGARSATDPLPGDARAAHGWRRWPRRRDQRAQDRLERARRRGPALPDRATSSARLSRPVPAGCGSRRAAFSALVSVCPPASTQQTSCHRHGGVPGFGRVQAGSQRAGVLGVRRVAPGFRAPTSAHRLAGPDL
jgi:hypothetical protein